jgi:hypothetical protein
MSIYAELWQLERVRDRSAQRKTLTREAEEEWN